MKFVSKQSITLMLVFALLAAFASLALAQGNVLSDPPKNYTLVNGWYKGQAVSYYEFAANSATANGGAEIVPAPIYALITGFDADGNPQFVEGQNNIVDVIPGDTGYSDLWQVNLVTVPANYEANSFTSVEEVLASGYEIIQPGLLVNCPIVPAGSTLEAGGDLIAGWYKGQEIFYFEFGTNPVQTAPIYALITGFDADGNPQFVEGQNNIVDVIPGDTGYSAFWQVNLVTVPADYQANTFTSVEQVLNSGYEIVTPGLVVNCPVPEAGLPDPSAMADTTSTDTTSTEEASTDTATTDGATTETTTTENPSPTSLPATGGNQNSSVLLLIVAGLLALSAGIVLKFKTNTNNKAI